MADYKPLLTRALAALPETSAEARQAVYQRARVALGRQFANPAAAIPPEVAERELASLEEAIAALEAEHGKPSPQAAEPGPAPAVEGPLPPVSGTIAEPATQPERPAIPVPPPPPPVQPLPPEPGIAPVFPPAQAPAARAAGMPAPPALPSQPPRPRAEAPAAAPAAPTDIESQPKQPDLAAPAVPTRPKAPQRDQPQRSGKLKLALIALTGLVVAAVGTFAWLRRNEPPAVASNPPVVASRPEASRPPAGKVEERVGGDPGPVRPSPTPAAPSPAPQPAVTPPPLPAPVAIANRLIFIEEGRDNPQNVVVRQGSAVWRIDSVSGGQGQPLETVIRVDLDIPEARLRAEMTMRRNRDRAFPASHTIELRFAAQPGNEIGPLAQLNVVEARQVENQPGFPMVGQGITVMENVFLIALSAADQLAERNIEMLRQRPWIYMEAQLVSGRRIAMVFEKGVSGQQVFEDAIRTW